jgi:hypothetical protein
MISFYEGSLSDSALNVCSALAAAEHGDARRAFLNISRMAFSDSPTHFDNISGPFTAMKFGFWAEFRKTMLIIR